MSNLFLPNRHYRKWPIGRPLAGFLIPNPKSIVKTVVYITFLLRRLKTRSLVRLNLLHSRVPVHSCQHARESEKIKNLKFKTRLESYTQDLLPPADVSLPFALLAPAGHVGPPLPERNQEVPDPGRDLLLLMPGRHTIRPAETTTITFTTTNAAAAAAATAAIPSGAGSGVPFRLLPLLLLLLLILVGRRWFPLQLYGAALPRAVHDLQLRVDDFLDQLVRLGRQHGPLWVLLEHLDARLVHQKGVVQDVEIVVEDAEGVALRHLITFALPT